MADHDFKILSAEATTAVSDKSSFAKHRQTSQLCSRVMNSEHLKGRQSNRSHYLRT